MKAKLLQQLKKRKRQIDRRIDKRYGAGSTPMIQPDEFLEEAIIEADGTMVQTYGEKKEGIGMNYKKQWGYHPLVVTLACSLKAWSALMIRPEGSEEQQAGYTATKRRVLRMEFHTFRQTLINIPAQIVRGSSWSQFDILRHLWLIATKLSINKASSFSRLEGFHLLVDMLVLPARLLYNMLCHPVLP